VRLVYKDLPLRRHTLAHGAHEAARCAGAEGRYWAYHDRLYANQPAFDRAHLIRYASEIGLNSTAFTRCLDNHEFADQIEADIEQSLELGIHGTPTFLINGRRLIGAHPIESFRDMIDEALAKAKPKK
jgi:protein-disulfide isomerase